MADHVLESRLWVARPRDDVFAFFADAANLARITPPAVGFRVLTEPATLAAGAVLDGRISWFGVPIRWRAFIREYDPPFRFVDVQLRGPWRRWEHRHRFLEESGGTAIEDRVTYGLPLGGLGQLAHALVVRRQLTDLWRYRAVRLRELLEGRSA
jgi:ligand-binding SRPBCC domain-containing protein